MLRLDRPGLLAAARAETGAGVFLVDVERARPLGAGLGDDELLSVDERRIPGDGVDIFLTELAIAYQGATAQAVKLSFNPATGPADKGEAMDEGW